jgi:acetate kinase
VVTLIGCIEPAPRAGALKMTSRDELVGDVLAVNGGSSSIKFALFATGTSAQVVTGAVVGVGTPTATLVVDDARSSQRVVLEGSRTALRTVVDRIMAAVEPHLHAGSLAGIVHRVVHGGERFDRSQLITPDLMESLRALIPLAPNHLADEIALIDAFMAATPDSSHVACFDTAFHRDLPAISRTLPVPVASGLRRYGFHGLSYAFLLSALNDAAGDEARGRVVLAHLGNGASLAAVLDGRCVDTSMGLTPAGGLVMSSRTGDIDPGVLTYIARLRHLSLEEVDRLATQESGLLAISGRSADMQELLALESSDPRARLAVDVFCYQVRKWIGAFAAALGGLDTLVFSGGIGEHASLVRSRICGDLAFLGVHVDDELNTANAPLISGSAARVRVRVIPTNEALMMATEARTVLATLGPRAES